MEEMTAYWMQKCFELWKILDDIDTASDMFKTSYEALATFVYTAQQMRHDVLGTRDVNLLYDMFYDPKTDILYDPEDEIDDNQVDTDSD